MKTITEEALIDYLADELPPAQRRAVEAALENDAMLRAELAELQALLNEVAGQPDPAPSARADARFAAALEAALANAAPAGAKPLARVRSLPRFSYRTVAAAVVILGVFASGWYLGNRADRSLEQELAATRALMLELMHNASPSTRIQAATVTLELTIADPVSIGQLGYLLRNDESANVRLAALDALRRFTGSELARAELLAAMGEGPPDVVRFELIETLVRCQEARVLPYLEDIIQTDSLPQPVRDAAQLASFKLI
ncbi:HEAT repeat domain-containing protein [Neolewinella lacunae]|uniref:HEAT repeat domain-containing protein n=1 Tax=Neolewinella lacunae TaxID=1517758 RepID=A0A923PLK8_9BACT|nr:HEAT repeat domain-containing protein [Neolewinella lacunae]MBC6996317.1 HEAT repeat domain-containing protein [Neolewinella lacunae]MDN3636940.1 HEAT repeat domain-containing protein [Neolewinella lacunae]